MRSVKRMWRVGAACLAIAIIAGCGNGQTSGASATGSGGSTTIRLAYPVPVANLADIQLFIAQDRGLFSKCGVSVKLTMLNGDTPALQSLVSGGSDVSLNSSPLIYQSVLKQAGVRAFIEPTPKITYQLVAKSTITKPDHMIGHVLATSGPGGIAEVLPFLALEKEGVDTSKVQTVNSGTGAQRVKALAAGRVDATILHADQTFDFLRTNPEFHVLLNLGKTLPDIQYAAYAAKNDYIKSNRAALICFSKGLLEGSNIANQDAGAVIAAYTKARPGADRDAAMKAYAVLKEAGAFDPTGGLSEKSFNSIVSSLVKAGLLKSPVKYADAITTDIRDAAREAK